MPNYLYSAKTNSFYPESDKGVYVRAGTWPLDLITVTQEEWEEYGLAAPPLGKTRGSSVIGRPSWIDIPNQSPEQISAQENYWVEKELERIRDELEKVQDSDLNAIGSVSDWRNYRKSLRIWPESQNFPNQEFRPKAPDAK